MSSLYAQYMKERENADTYEDNTGFISYKFESSVCIICNIYVVPMYRCSNVGRRFGEHVEQLCKEKEIKEIVCTADREALNFKDASEFILKNGYKILTQDGSLVYFKKEIE